MQVNSLTHHPMTHQQVTQIEPPGSTTVPVNNWARAYPLPGPGDSKKQPSVGLGPVLASRESLSGSFASLGLSLPSFEMGMMILNTRG